MAEYDAGWKRLAAAARRAPAPGDGLSAERVRDLAVLARRSALARPWAPLERRSLLALAVLLVCALLALVPYRTEVGALLASTRADLAALPSRVPRPPRPPSAARALEALPDLGSFLDLTPLSSESPP